MSASPTSSSGHEITAQTGSIDDLLLRILPWLASRYEFTTGEFLDPQRADSRAAGITTAQAISILKAIDLYAALPHVIKIKLAARPELPEEALCALSQGSALAGVTHRNCLRDAAAFMRAVEPFATNDGGFSLEENFRGPGMMAAAHHLVLVARPAWYRARNRSVPHFDAEQAERFARRLLPVFGH